MISIIFQYLKRHKTSTAICLLTILSWILYLLGMVNAGHCLILSAITIFVLIMILGQTEDKATRQQEELDKFKI